MKTTTFDIIKLSLLRLLFEYNTFNLIDLFSQPSWKSNKRPKLNILIIETSLNIL